MSTNIYYCYLITSKNRTYIGITNNLLRRIKSHNKIIKKGAKSTGCMKNWCYHTIIGDFNTRGRALRFEYYWKHIQNSKNKWVRNKPLITNKMKRLLELIFQDEWKDLKIIKNIYL